MPCSAWRAARCSWSAAPPAMRWVQPAFFLLASIMLCKCLPCRRTPGCLAAQPPLFCTIASWPSTHPLTHPLAKPPTHSCHLAQGEMTKLGSLLVSGASNARYAAFLGLEHYLVLDPRTLRWVHLIDWMKTCFVAAWWATPGGWFASSRWAKQVVGPWQSWAERLQLVHSCIVKALTGLLLIHAQGILQSAALAQRVGSTHGGSHPQPASLPNCDAGRAGSTRLTSWQTCLRRCWARCTWTLAGRRRTPFAAACWAPVWTGARWRRTQRTGRACSGAGQGRGGVSSRQL